MGFQAILTSFFQSSFFLIKVFQGFKAGGQINRLYTSVYQHLSGPLLRALEYPSTTKWWQSGANHKKGGVMSGILLQSPQEALRAALRHPSDGCRSRAGGTCLQYIVSTIPEASDRKSTRLNSSHDVISRMPSSA